MLIEHWKVHPDYPKYMISTQGRVVGAFGRILRTPTNAVGYPVCNIGKGNTRTVHTLMLETFVGPRLGRCGLHWNDVKTDNRLENLRWGTRSDNIYDTYRNRQVSRIGGIR